MTKKIVIALATILATMLIVPLLIVRLASPQAGMGLCIILFFAVIPAVNLFLGWLSGRQLKALWWIPPAAAAAFPLLFAIAVQDVVWELYIYSAFYLLIGAGTMAISHFIKKHEEKHKP